jgi:hypothetical protein
MGLFNKTKTNGQESSDSTEKKEKNEIIIDRPRICCVDLTSKDFNNLKSESYNLYEGSLGPIYRVPNKSRHDYSHIALDYSLPVNFHEFDILILDLTNEKTVDYKEEDHKMQDTRRKSVLKLVCSYPTTLFDQRPLVSSFLLSNINQITSRDFLQIVFACENYNIEYEMIKITDDYPERQPGAKHNIYSFWNGIPLSDVRTGKDVTVYDDIRSDMFSLLSKHTKNLTYSQTFYHPTKYTKEEGNIPDPLFTPLLKNINNEIVAFAKFTNHLITVVLPNIENKGGFLSDFLKNIGPSLFPEIFPYSTQFKWKESSEYYLPNQSKLIDEQEGNEKEYYEKNKQVEEKIIANQEKYQFLHDLIIETGEPLVKAVKVFLEWLGFSKVVIMDEESSDKLEEDIQAEHDKGLLIIETKGIGGTSTDSDCSQISKIKHRRCEERNKFDVFALYIVNHQRYLPPLKRKNPPFTEDQIKDAYNDKRGLLTTWQLFNLYHYIENDIITKDDARAEILKFGYIEFRPKTKNKLTTPKQILKNGKVAIVEVAGTKLEIGQVLIAEKKDKFFKTKILSIQVDNKDVAEIENGEIGLMLDRAISNGTTLWTQ